MKDLIAVLENAANIFESAGFIREAYKIDVLANTVESALAPPPVTDTPLTRYPSVRQRVPQQTFRDPHNKLNSPSKPAAWDIIYRNRDSVGNQLEAVRAGIEAIKHLLDQMTQEASKAYPQRAGATAQETQKSKDRLEALYSRVEDAVKQELRNFLVSAGGIDEASRYSIDHLNLAG